MLRNKEGQHMNDFDEFTQKYDISLLRAASHKNRTYRQKNRTTLTSAHHSKAVTNTMQTIIPKNYATHQIERDNSNGCDNFVKKLRVRLGYIEEDVLREVIRVAEETFSELDRKSHSRIGSIENGKSQLDRATKISMRSRSNYTVDYNQ
jgi:hypothetical protein